MQRTVKTTTATILTVTEGKQEQRELVVTETKPESVHRAVKKALKGKDFIILSNIIKETTYYLDDEIFFKYATTAPNTETENA